MNSAEFVDKLSTRLECTKKDADKAFKAVLAEIGDCLAKGEKISIIGFGSFEVSIWLLAKAEILKLAQRLTFQPVSALCLRRVRNLEKKSNKAYF